MNVSRRGRWRRLAVLAVLAACSASEGEETVSSTNPASSPQRLTVIGNTLFFTADDGLCGREVWMYEPAPPGDPAPGKCQLVADIMPGPESSQPEDLTDCGGCLFWLARPSKDLCRLYCFVPSTKQVFPVQGETSDLHWNQLSIPTMLGGMAFFRAGLGPSEQNLYALKPGAVSATVALEYDNFMNRQRARAFTSCAGRIFYCGNDGLRVTDGTVQGTYTLGEMAGPSGVTGVALGSSSLLFCGMEREHGMEPWISDGTSEGTRLLRDIRPGPLNSLKEGFHVHGGTGFFSADDGIHGYELWKTDGTPEGTTLVKDINAGSAAGDPHYFRSVGSWVYFAATDADHGLELWKTDGSEANTALVLDMQPGTAGTDIWSLCEFQGRLYFCAKSPDYGEEILSTDGTARGTHILKDIVPGPGSSGPSNLIVMGHTLYFTCDDGLHGDELWMSDGTAEGTRLAADVAVPQFNPSSSPRQLTALDDGVFFTVSDREHGEELWKSDGSNTGTLLVKDIAEGPASSAPKGLAVAGHHVFFSADDGVSGRELWCTDGAENNTARIRDIFPGPSGSNPDLITSLDGSAYFAATEAEHGRQLWRSDGTEAETARVSDIASGTNSDIADIFTFRNNVYFYTTQADSASALWRVEGATAREIGPVPRTCSFEDLAPMTAASDEQRLVPFVRPCGQRKRSCQSVTLGVYTFFAGRSQATGAELWRTDGTLAGTQLVYDAFPGTPSSSPAHLAVVGDSLYFVADTPRESRCLWRTDGTRNGTHVVQSEWGGAPTVMAFIDDAVVLGKHQDKLMFSMMFPRRDGILGNNVLGVDVPFSDGDKYYVSSGHPLGHLRKACRFDELTCAGDQVFFVIDDGTHGRELWVNNGLPGMAATSHMAKDILVPADIRALRRQP